MYTKNTAVKHSVHYVVSISWLIIDTPKYDEDTLIEQSFTLIQQSENPTVHSNKTVSFRT